MNEKVGTRQSQNQSGANILRLGMKVRNLAASQRANCSLRSK